MGLFSEFKRNSRLAMRGHWAGGALILLIHVGALALLQAVRQVALSVFVLSPAINSFPFGGIGQGEYVRVLGNILINSRAEWAITGIFSLLQALIICPLSLGAIRWYLKIADGENPSISEAFRFFETPGLYFKAIWYDINISIRSMLWSVLFYAIPGVVFGISVYYLSLGKEDLRLRNMTATAGVFFSALLFLTATLLFAGFINRYALVPYLISENTEITVNSAVKASIAYSKGSRFSMLWFSFTFLGWVLLCVLFLPIFFVMPYYMASFAIFARYIIERNRRGERGEI